MPVLFYRFENQEYTCTCITLCTVSSSVLHNKTPRNLNSALSITYYLSMSVVSASVNFLLQGPYNTEQKRSQLCVGGLHGIYDQTIPLTPEFH